MLPHWLETALVATALPAMVLALTVSVVVVMAGWRRRRELLQRQGRPFVAARMELDRSTFAAGVLDVALEAMAVMRQFECFAAERYVALELAVQPGLAVRTDARVFREIVGDLVSHAIEQSPCGRVLLGAAHIGGRVQITVSDEAAHSDRALRASELRPAERLAALQGATLEIDARPGQGTTVVLRLPAAASGRNAKVEAEVVLDPASVWAPAQRAREGSNVGRL
jgi:signal transduction histidine kinase